MERAVLRNLASLAVLAFGLTACGEKPPGTSATAGPGPRAIAEGRTLHNPPPLAGTGDAARQSVKKFIDWAGGSVPDEREDGRRAIEAARGNADVATALIDELNAARKGDQSRALLILAILGELRDPRGEQAMAAIVREPLPTETPGPEGDMPLREAAERIEGKAVQGLAYAGTPSATAVVLETAARHPSQAVRAEAIASYLWNQKDQEAARRELLQRIRPEDRIFLDRPRMEPGENAASFNRKLAAYVAGHPEVRPPAPPRPEGREQRPFERRQAAGGEPPPTW